MNFLNKIYLSPLLALAAATAIAQNPIVPEGMYMSDPSARQWTKGGPVYIYGSRDESLNYYCSYDYDVLVSDDMKTFKLHPYVFSSRGDNDQVSYNDNLLFAPDCIYKDGKYYLFYCQGGSQGAEGVATSDSPTGPFKDGKLIKEATEIDPSVFFDTDGNPYLFYGQYSGKSVPLSKDLMPIDQAAIKNNIITEKDHAFHEGIQVLKRGDWYYLVYADISQRGMPTSIGYSMSRNLMGPYEYKGVIVDNFGCDPNVWNNHGSIAEVDGKWYVFYHRATNGSEYMRKACVEPITFNPDGTINQVEMTTQGAAGPLNPFDTMEAWRTCYLMGNARISLIKQGDYHTNTPGVEMITNIRNRDSAAFRYFDFTKMPKKITVTVVPEAGGSIDVFANNLSRPRLAVIKVPEGNGNTPLTITVDVHAPSEKSFLGVHPIFFRFHGAKGKDLMKFVSFKFEE